MANPLFDRASPKDLASRGQVIEVTVKLEDVGRLAEIVAEDLATLPRAKRPREWRAAPVNIRLGFAFLDVRGKIPRLSCSIDTTIAAVCQRCLLPMELPLITTLDLLLLTAADDVAGLDEFEVWEIEEDEVRPLDIVEEALVMALPAAAMHTTSELCRPLDADASGEKKDIVRPFADLRSQMNKLN